MMSGGGVVVGGGGEGGGFHNLVNLFKVARSDFGAHE